MGSRAKLNNSDLATGGGGKERGARRRRRKKTSTTAGATGWGVMLLFPTYTQAHENLRKNGNRERERKWRRDGSIRNACIVRVGREEMHTHS